MQQDALRAVSEGFGIELALLVTLDARLDWQSKQPLIPACNFLAADEIEVRARPVVLVVLTPSVKSASSSTWAEPDVEAWKLRKDAASNANATAEAD